MPLFSQDDPPIKDKRIELDIVIAARGGALRAEQKIVVLSGEGEERTLLSTNIL